MSDFALSEIVIIKSDLSAAYLYSLIAFISPIVSGAEKNTVS